MSEPHHCAGRNCPPDCSLSPPLRAQALRLHGMQADAGEIDPALPEEQRRQAEAVAQFRRHMSGELRAEADARRREEAILARVEEEEVCTTAPPRPALHPLAPLRPAPPRALRPALRPACPICTG